MNGDKDFEEIVQAAAQSVPAYQYNLDGVTRRGRRHRRNRYAAVGVAAALAVATVAAIPVWYEGAKRTTPAASPTVSASAAPITALAQRWQVRGGGAEFLTFPSGYQPSEGLTKETLPKGTTGVWHGEGELLVDGSLKQSPRSSLIRDGAFVDQAFLMSDGGYALNVFRDLKPGHRDGREDGPCVTDVDSWLVIMDASGKETLKRMLHKRCHPWTLVGADATYAYLVRDGKVWRHTLADGKESVLFSISVLPEVADGQGQTGTMDIVTMFGRFLLVTSRTYGTSDADFMIRVRTVNLDTGATGERTFELPLAKVALDPVHGGVLSPDGKRVAFAPAADAPADVFVGDLSTGLLKRIKGEPGFGCAGVGWADTDTIRVGWYEFQQKEVVDFAAALTTSDHHF